MKRMLLTASLLVLSLAPAAAQITLDASLLRDVVGKHVQASVYTVNDAPNANFDAIKNALGGNQTYDFTPYTYTAPLGTEYDVLPSAAGTPGATDADLGGANWVERLDAGGTFYAYYDLRDDGFFLLGSIFVQATDTDGNGVLDQSVQKNAPPDPTYLFPLTATSAWSQDLVSTVEGFGSTSETSSTVDFLVEGWGTLITPAGSAPALRLRKILTVSGAGIEGYTTTTTLFVTNGPLGASIIRDEQGAVFPSGASYSVTNGTATAMEDVPAFAYRLFPNYPNPFASATSITYELERPGHVTLRVFDVIGREVRRLVDAPLPAGSFTADFRAEDLPSGVYLCRLEVDGYVATRRLVLRK